MNTMTMCGHQISMNAIHRMIATLSLDRDLLIVGLKTKTANVLTIKQRGRNEIKAVSVLWG